MAHLQIRLRHTKSHAPCECDFESWLIRQHIGESEEKRILEEWRSFPNQDPLKLFPMPKVGHQWNLIPRPAADPVPPGLTPLRGPFDLHHVSPAFAKSIFEWTESLTHIPYKVIILNSTSEDLGNLTITYHVNQYLGGQVMATGPFTKSLSALPPSETVGFDLCPCLYMATNYDVSFVNLSSNEPTSFSLNIDKLNAQEKIDLGNVDFCDDSLEVFPL